MNIDNLKFDEKILLINLIVKYKAECECIRECECGCDFSERLDRFSERYNVSLNNVVSLFSKLNKNGFLIKERRYPEKNKAKYRYSLKHNLMDWLGGELVLGAREKTSDFKFFLREMENRYPNANRTISAGQRWLLLILIAHQDEFGTVTHLTINDLCYLMGGISEGQFKRIQKKSIDAELISVLKTSATFFNEVKNVYVLKGVKGKKIKDIKQQELLSPCLPNAIDLFDKLYLNHEHYKSAYRYIVKEDQDIQILLILKPITEKERDFFRQKYYSRNAWDTGDLMQIKLNRIASKILSECWDDLLISQQDIAKKRAICKQKKYSEQERHDFIQARRFELLKVKLSQKHSIYELLHWDKLLTKGMLKTLMCVSDDDLTCCLMYGLYQKSEVDITNLEIKYGEEQIIALRLYVLLVQGMVAFSIGIAYQYASLLIQNGWINVNKQNNRYHHIITSNNIPRTFKVHGEVVPLLSIHSYFPNEKENEFYHVINYLKNKTEKKKITYKRTMIESTLIT